MTGEAPGLVLLTLGQRAARGALITVGAQFIRIFVQVAGVVFLARLLSPGDYGLVAMVTAVVGVAEIFRDFGLSAAAIQVKHLSRAQRDNLFWLNTSAGLVLSAIVFLAAPGLALWYDRPELVGIAHWLAPIFLLNGMTTQYRADLNRRLQFHRIAFIDVLAPVVALGAALGAALAGASYWALVAQQLTASSVLLLATAIAARWLPRLPRRKEPMGDLLSFGWNLAGAQFIGYLGNNVDSLTIGYRFGPSALGLYNRGFQLLMAPLGQLRSPTTTVALPILARLRNDSNSSNRYVQQGQIAMGFTLVAGVALVLGAAGPITAIFLGPKWIEVEPLIRLLAASGILQTLAFVGYWVYLAHGLTKELLHYTILVVPIKICCILIGSHWGVTGVAAGYLIAHALEWPLSFVWLSRKTNINVRGLYLGAARILVLASVVATSAYGACYVTAFLSQWVQLGGAVLAAAVSYGLVMILPAFRRDFLDVLSIVRAGMTQRRGTR